MSEVNEANEPSSEEITELEKLLRSGKPWFEANGTILIYAVAAVLAIAAVFVYMNRQPSGNSQASADVLLASSAEDFRDVADAYPDSKIGVWSRLQQADRTLDNCVRAMFTNREEGLTMLDQAETAFERLAERSDIDELVRQRVLIGLARVAEIKCDGSEQAANAAIEAWQRLQDEYPKSILRDHAENRITQLASTESRSFYTWFHELSPEPIDPGLPPGQTEVPGIPAMGEDGTTDPEEPNAPDAEPVPEEANADKPEADKPETDKPETDKPETDKPETDKPEADKPEADKPEADKPETDKPKDSATEDSN